MSEIKVLKFSAEWCGPCRMLDPIVEELKKEYTDITFESIDVDDAENNEVTQKYAIRSVPSVFILKDEEVVDRFVGFKDGNSIKSILDKVQGKEETEDDKKEE